MNLLPGVTRTGVIITQATVLTPLIMLNAASTLEDVMGNFRIVMSRLQRAAAISLS